MYGFRVGLVGQSIYMNLIRHHERGVEAQSKVSDDLIRIALILIFLDKVRSSGKGNLIDVLLHLFRSHAQTVIDEGQRLLLRVYDHFHLCLVPLRQSILSHHVQLLQLGHGITAVGNQFPVKNVMIGVQPLLDDWKNVFTVNR